MEASSRLYFRALKTEDTAALINIYSDVEAMKFRANPPVLTTEDALKMIKAAASSSRLAVVLNETNELIGTFVLSYNKPNSTCTIGYSIGKTFWKKGYGKELLKAMLKEVKHSSTTQIKAFVHPQNLASIAILKQQQFDLIDTDASEHLLTYCLTISL